MSCHVHGNEWDSKAMLTNLKLGWHEATEAIILGMSVCTFYHLNFSWQTNVRAVPENKEFKLNAMVIHSELCFQKQLRTDVL